jgi:hypothetical protein
MSYIQKRWIVLIATRDEVVGIRKDTIRFDSEEGARDWYKARVENGHDKDDVSVYLCTIVERMDGR